ncbi:MAG: wax ester/triacylglycerol synthase family O-acyltransferase [Ideonella sp.]|nr:wax ester/triacylglycerol synthase family O-acyltransferase [Ideonella sp.]
MNALETLLWRIEADPRFRSTLMTVEILDCVPQWDRMHAAHEWGSRMVPRFRQRVIEPAMGLGSPVWATDPNFDLAYHLRRVCLPPPGTMQQVLELAQTMAMAPFDRARPPWEAMLVEGLAGGQAAYLLKMHHSVTDGIGGIQLLARMHSRSRQRDPHKPQPAPPPADPSTPVTVLGESMQRRAKAGMGALTSWSSAASAWSRRLAAQPRQVLAEAAALGESVARQLRAPAPPSPLLAGRSLSYRYDAHEVPLADFKAAAKAAGGSINDAFLAAVTGAFARYHRACRAKVDELAMSMPINLRKADEPMGGNRIGAARLAGPMDEPSAVRRMQLLHEQVEQARADTAFDLTGAVAPMLALLPAATLAQVFSRMAQGNDVQTSNVPGIAEPVYFAGAQVTHMFPFGPLPGCAAMVTLVSHNGICCIGVNVDPAAVTRQDLFAQCLRAASMRCWRWPVPCRPVPLPPAVGGPRGTQWLPIPPPAESAPCREYLHHDDPIAPA